MRETWMLMWEMVRRLWWTRMQITCLNRAPTYYFHLIFLLENNVDPDLPGHQTFEEKARIWTLIQIYCVLNFFKQNAWIKILSKHLRIKMKKRNKKETMISSVQIPFYSYYFDNAGIRNVPPSCSSFCARMLY